MSWLCVNEVGNTTREPGLLFLATEWRQRPYRSITIDPAHAQMLLLKCNGDEIWDVDTCRSLGVPESWIEELQDCFESGFDSDANTIYHQDRLVNQYEGVHDLQLACKLADYLGIDHRRVTAAAFSRQAQVRALQAELDEL